MFEGSLVESRGLVVSRAQRWSAVGSAALQLALAALIVVLPLMRPQTMKILTAVPHLTAPAPVRPPVPVPVAMNQATNPMSAPSVRQALSPGTRQISLTPGTPTDDRPPGPITNIQIGGGPTGMPNLAGTNGTPAVTVARPEHIGPLNVSKGVSEGMLLAPIRPVYPAIAKATGTQGTVVIEAIISKTGKIESAHVVSGPALLQQAALNAVEAARYRAYLLSGEPVEVQTTVTVVFKLGE